MTSGTTWWITWAMPTGAGGGRDRVPEEGGEVRRGAAAVQRDGWYRHITLALLAHTYLAAIRHEAMEQGEKGAATAPMKN